MAKIYDATNVKDTEIFEKDAKNINDKKIAIREYRKEASRLASLANKRVERLERNDFKDSPAYKKYIEGQPKFSVRGKTYNELQQEVSRLRRFINTETSTIKGITNTLKEMAKNTGINYENLKDLKLKSSKFFELSSKVEQYLRTVDDMASAIGYQKIWEVINQYVKDSEIDLSDSDVKIDDMITKVTDALKEYDKPAEIIGGWYSLKKEDV